MEHFRPVRVIGGHVVMPEPMLRDLLDRRADALMEWLLGDSLDWDAVERARNEAWLGEGAAEREDV